MRLFIPYLGTMAVHTTNLLTQGPVSSYKILPFEFEYSSRFNKTGIFCYLILGSDQCEGTPSFSSVGERHTST